MYLSNTKTTLESENQNEAIVSLRHYNGFGLFNDTCSSSSDCLTNLNLVCKNGLCACIQGFVPDTTGACEISTHDLMLIWAIRFALTAAVLLICVLVLYIVFNKGACCCRRQESSNNLLEAEGGHHANDACCHEAPPPYLEVVCPPPPTYSEAIAKMSKLPAFDSQSHSHLERSNSICNLYVTTAADSTSTEGSSAITKEEETTSSAQSSSEFADDVALHI